MTRNHRIAHRLAWPALALAVSLAFIIALALRAPPPESPPPAQEQSR